MKRTFACLLALMLLLSATAFAAKKPDAEYWLTDEPVTLTYFMRHDSQTDFNQSNELFQTFERLTNVHIDWIIVSSADYETRKSLMWASDDLPDIIGIPSTEEVLKYSAYGALVKIDEYMHECMPNFVAAMNTDAFAPSDDFVGIEQMLKLDDGHIYALPKMGLSYYSTGAAEFINQSWLDKLGLEMPETVEELREVLIAFRDRDPNGNGLNDEIPFTFLWTEAGNDRIIGGMYTWFGVSPGIMIRDGEVSFSPIKDDYRTMVKYYADLWKEGLIDQEVFTQSQSTYSAKGYVTPSIYGVLGGWRMGIYLSTDNIGQYEVLPAQYCADTELSGAMRTQMGYGRDWVLNTAVVSAKSKHVELALKWLDMFYDPYYGSQISDGYIGAHLYEREDGQFVEVPDEQIPPQYSSRVDWKGATMCNDFPLYKAPEHCTYMATNAEWAKQMMHQSDVYEGKYINEVMPFCYQLPEEYDTLTEYKVDIMSYVNEMFALWVTGERDVDADWDGYIAHLEQLKVHDYVAEYQAFYDRVMKK